MCVGRYAEKMQWSEAKWNLFEMPAIDMSVLCIPAECDNIKLPIEYELASRGDANLLYDICRHFASVMLHFASLISHNLRCIPAYAHLIPTGFFLLNYHRGNLYIISIKKHLEETDSEAQYSFMCVALRILESAQLELFGIEFFQPTVV